MRYPNMISLYFATPLTFSAPTERYLWDGMISIKYCTEVKGWLRYKMSKVSTPLAGHTARTLQMTDGFAIAKTQT